LISRLKDRVIILEDKDWDGVAETRKVFTEDVQMLTSVEVGRGGVWLMCPPQVLFIPDRNGDDIPDGEPRGRARWLHRREGQLPQLRQRPALWRPMAGSTVAAVTPAPASSAFPARPTNSACR
jgi:hypothetical protein